MTKTPCARTANGVGGLHLHIDDFMTEQKQKLLIAGITELVRLTMKLPPDAVVTWFLAGSRSPWVLEYTDQGQWHTDVAQNTKVGCRTWSLSVTLASLNSSFFIESNTKTLEVTSKVVIFPNHLPHRGNVPENGLRKIFAAEFSLDKKAQVFVLNRN